MKLIELVDKYLENPYDIHLTDHRGGFYPSQASCIIKNEYGEDTVIGKCLRSAFWEQKSVKKSNPMKARGARICAVGKMVERFEVEQYKQLGIWRDNNVKFFDTNNNISGEADCIVFDKDTNSLRGVEIKSGYDYKFRTEVIGTPTRPGRPKWEHLLQTMYYVDHFKIPFDLLYFDRGNAARKGYEVTLNSDGSPSVDKKKVTNGLTIPRSLARFKELKEMVEDNTLPKRDFQLKYSKERIEVLKNSRRLNKGQKEEFEKNNDVDMGDWECSYCDYKDYCWGKDGKNS